MHKKQISVAGAPIGEGRNVLIMLHGRGASAEDILGLSSHLQVQEFTLLAPQATGNSWYPFSFLSPVERNEPWLSSAIDLLSEIVDDTVSQGVDRSRIYFLGFSQGACLTLEFLARNAARYGGVAAFTGGLIGDKINIRQYKGSFDSTPVFLGTSDPDPHVPVERVYATSNILRNMNAVVTEKIYSNLGHTINQDELDTVNRIIFSNGQTENGLV